MRAWILRLIDIIYFQVEHANVNYHMVNHENFEVHPSRNNGRLGWSRGNEADTVLYNTKIGGFIIKW
jgi:hypothetical protein